MKTWTCTAMLALATTATLTLTAKAESEDLGNGFMDHGVATPISNHRGTVATVDGEGKPVVLSWLMDHRGGYCLLMLDMTTGESQQFATPWSGDSPFASILSSRNRFYTHVGSWFVEFDPVKRAMTFEKQTVPRMAMSMTEDDDGVIWSATYPQSGVASYDPATGTFRDYGHVYKQNWAQYPRAIAADDTGWVYLGIGNTASQIVMLNPESGEATPVIPEDERGHGRAVVQRDQNGKVYGWFKDAWWELYEGKATRIEEPAERKPKSYIASHQGLFHRQAPTGDRLVNLDLVNRRLTVETAEGEERSMDFDYESEGAHIMGVGTASNGTVCGGTAFPMRFFSYNPAKDEWINRDAYGQWNTVAGTDGPFYVGGYTGGFLLEWDPSKPWVHTEKGNAESNPLFLDQAKPTINRPHDLLVHPDGRHVILAGTPGYGLTGGGLLIWDRQEKKAAILTHTDLLEWHSVMAMTPLPDGNLLCGTTTAPGTGGESQVDEAQLFILDMASRKVSWHAPLIKGARNYTDMIPAPDGKILGFADRSRFFVFDPQTNAVTLERNVAEQFGNTTSSQGPRVFVKAPDGRYFVLFAEGIAQLDPATYEITMLAKSPVSIVPGGAWLNGRIYFGHASHVYSWQVPEAD